MSTLKQLYQIEKNPEDIRVTILTNIVKMLNARKLIADKDLNKIIENVTTKISDDMVYLIDNNFAIKISPQKITAFNRSFGISEFLVQYKNNPKIVVVNDISKKARQYIINNFTGTEIFLEEELMINLIDHDLVPDHEMLTKEQVQQFYTEFGCKKKNMPKLLSTDPVARYYNMKPGDICRVIRASDKCGFGISYRLVVKSSFK